MANSGLFDFDGVVAATRALLTAIGEDVTREGIVDTPTRVAKAWSEFLSAKSASLSTTFGTTFGTNVSDQMVVVSGMRMWSMCEHHLLPFWCDVTVGYIPREHLLGLSKFARIAQTYAGRLQLQERLVSQIAEHVQEVTGTPDVAVIAQGEHLCMTMRGAKTDARMTSSILLGQFKASASCRAEFLALAMQNKHS